MSFSIKAAEYQNHDDVVLAIKEDDDVTLYHYASRAKEAGEDEQAEALLKLARTAAKNQWAFDCERDNNL